MKNKLLYTLRSGKHPKFVYYGLNMLRMLIPGLWHRMRLHRVLASAARRDDIEYINRRVEYYNRLSQPMPLPADAPPLKAHKMGRHKVYFFDTHEYTRWFPPHYRWCFCPGDVTYVPPVPAIVKSRPLVPDNRNSIVMKLNKARHFIFVDDKKAFADKQDRVIFRGKVKDKPNRRQFMEMYFQHPLCDLGDVSKRTTDPAEWQTEKKTIREHLDYKFIMALEGNDVASNLKWVMSSNSIAVMPRPTCETWFMEGTLIPNYHYIEIKPDFSDLEERVTYYIQHPDEAQQIIAHAHDYVAPFRDKQRERLISLLVLDKYFRLTGQQPTVHMQYSPAYESIMPAILERINRFDTEGEIIYAGRNTIKVMTVGTRSINVKRYAVPSLFNRIVYSFFRKSKAERAFTYPNRLLQAGIETPRPIACLTNASFGLLAESYFISEQSPYRRNFYEFGNADIADCRDIVQALARFTAAMHEHGILHRDYSPGNILFDTVDGEYRFSLVDTNRMYFGKVSVEKGCANFARLWGQPAFFVELATRYAEARGADTAYCIERTLHYRKKFWKRHARKHGVQYKLEL